MYLSFLRDIKSSNITYHTEGVRCRIIMPNTCECVATRRRRLILRLLWVEFTDEIPSKWNTFGRNFIFSFLSLPTTRHTHTIRNTVTNRGTENGNICYGSDRIGEAIKLSHFYFSMRTATHHSCRSLLFAVEWWRSLLSIQFICSLFSLRSDDELMHLIDLCFDGVGCLLRCPCTFHAFHRSLTGSQSLYVRRAYCCVQYTALLRQRHKERRWKNEYETENKKQKRKRKTATICRNTKRSREERKTKTANVDIKMCVECACNIPTNIDNNWLSGSRLPHGGKNTTHLRALLPVCHRHCRRHRRRRLGCRLQSSFVLQNEYAISINKNWNWFRADFLLFVSSFSVSHSPLTHTQPQGRRLAVALFSPDATAFSSYIV